MVGKQGGGDERGASAAGPPEHGKEWLFKDAFALMELFLPELVSDASDADPAALRLRFLAVLRRGRRLRGARRVVTLLLALGTAAALSTALLGYLDLVPLAGPLVALLRRTAALAASFAVALVVVRLVLDHYLDLVRLQATFVAVLLGRAGRLLQREGGQGQAP